MKKYIIFFLPLFFILFSSKTYALVDNNTTYEITMPNYDNLLNFSCGDYNFKEELDNILQNIDFSSLSFDISVFNRLSNNLQTPTQFIDIYFYPKNNLANNFSIYYVGGSSLYFTQRNLPFSSSFRVSRISFHPDTCTDLSTDTNWNILKNAIENDTIPTVDNNHYEFPIPASIRMTNSSTIINNDFSATYWYYFSSNDLYYSFGRNQSTSDSNTYFKKLHLIDNDTYYIINNGSNDGPLPSYYDLYPPNENISSIDYLPSLGTIYNNFLPIEINNFNIDISFNTNSINAFEYNNNLEYTWSCYGRKNNNNNYYSYERFSYCDFEDNGNYDLSSNVLNLKFQNLLIYDTNDNIITDFSSYDKLFIYIDFQYKNTSLDTSLNNLSITSIGNNYYNNNFNGPIYDTFDLPLYFKMFVSTYRNDYSYFSIKYSGSTLTNKYFIYKQQYNTASLNSIGSSSFLGSTFQQLYVSNNFSIGYMFYHQISNQNSGIDLPSLDLIFNDSIIISINNTGNNFYYYDTNGNIVNDDIEVIYDNNDSSNFSLDYYFNKIYEYELDYFDKINKLHDIIQDFYDSLPLFIQSTFFIIFILFCTYFVYREARR